MATAIPLKRAAGITAQFGSTDTIPDQNLPAHWVTLLDRTVSNGGSGVATVQATGLSGYRFLRVRFFGSHTGSAVGTFGLRFNSDSGANYNNSSTTGATSTNLATSIPGTSNPNTYGDVRLDIFNLLAKEKKISGIAQGLNNSTGLSFVGAWINTAALISTIDVFTGSGNIADGSLVLVEGYA